ncbi:hypothetical protein [Photobacterium indicum]|uniref:Uncharacterized protein n=1 Tax=Photobacterium indicum TaxID=81447 RepID=A0A2T3LFE3_9GAMM|nr:hypothetical protein [Photobacterium indicum]PSV50039.1 hypothetical protein C9J47_05675 [Photobacterium indicum]
MIVDKVPPILVFTLDQGMNTDDKKRLSDLTALEDMTEEQQDEYAYLLSYSDSIDKGFVLENWIPIPIDADILGAQPDGYQTATTKKIQMVGNDPVLTGTSNSVTINIKTNSTILINTLLAFADYMFALNDSYPRMRYFSRDVVVLGGRLLSLSRSVNADTTEQIITLKIQKGDMGNPLKISTNKGPIEVELKDSPVFG